MPDPLFDSVAFTQAGMPHLLEHLEAKWCAHLEERVAKLRSAGKKSLDVEDALSHPFHVAFVRFCTEYLTENRVVENFYVDANHGIVLSDNSRCVICPGTDVAGTMQESGAVGVSTGRGQPGNEGVVKHKSLPIR